LGLQFCLRPLCLRQTLKYLTIINAHTCECLAIESTGRTRSASVIGNSSAFFHPFG
jgi:hypothetical protein